MLIVYDKHNSMVLLMFIVYVGSHFEYVISHVLITIWHYMDISLYKVLFLFIFA